MRRMNPAAVPVFALLLFAAITCRAAESVPAAAKLAASGVETRVGEWTDEARGGRVIPWRVYLPTGRPFRVPVVIVSHGLGGSRDAMGYLGEALAARGIATVHLQHAGSDRAVWVGKPFLSAAVDMKLAMNAENARLRVEDVAFALTRLSKPMGGAPGADWSAKLDLARIGVAGHSFGALTALQCVGLASANPAGQVDKRIKAALVLSPPPPPVDDPAAFDGITVPVFIFTGTKDEGPGIGSAADRLKNFGHLRHTRAWQVVFEGGDHRVYSGNESARSAPEAKAMYPAWRSCVADLAVTLFCAELCADTAAANRLKAEAVSTRVGKMGQVSTKP